MIKYQSQEPDVMTSTQKCPCNQYCYLIINHLFFCAASDTHFWKIPETSYIYKYRLK